MFSKLKDIFIRHADNEIANSLINQSKRNFLEKHDPDYARKNFGFLRATFIPISMALPSLATGFITTAAGAGHIALSGKMTNFDTNLAYYGSELVLSGSITSGLYFLSSAIIRNRINRHYDDLVQTLHH